MHVMYLSTLRPFSYTRTISLIYLEPSGWMATENMGLPSRDTQLGFSSFIPLASNIVSGQQMEKVKVLARTISLVGGAPSATCRNSERSGAILQFFFFVATLFQPVLLV